jgi:DNA-binding MarR family transcriptional regulator
VPESAETAFAPSLAGNVGYLLHRAFQHMQTIHAESAEKPHPRELSLVARLLATGPQPQHELAHALSVNRSVMVHVLDELERQGLVVRERNPSDRRSHLVTATAAGAVALERAAPAMLAADRRVTARLAPAKRERLYALLGGLLGPALPEVVAPTSQTVTYRIARGHFLLAARANHALEPLELDVREFGLLSSVHDLAPCSQQEIARRLDVSGPVIVELVDSLEARGLIVRERNPEDRRSYALRLSAPGEALLERARALIAAMVATIAHEGIGSAGMYELAALLREMLGGAAAAA